MSEKPILFSGEMINAILAGNKTVTRRVVKPQPESFVNCAHPWVDGRWEFGQSHDDGSGEMVGDAVACPYGAQGDKLWVRETFAVHNIGGENHVVYRADSGTDGDGAPWKPSIFMPRWASRITLEVVSVRVERLQDISEEDAKAEGVTGWHGVCRPEFHMLWDKINEGRGYSWDSNPWVWVVEFKRMP